MLTASYLAAAAAMVGAALYLAFRLRPFVTATNILIGLLLLIYGPACLSYTLSSGEYALLIRLFANAVPYHDPQFTIIKTRASDFDAVVTAMNFSLTSMYLGIIAGVEISDRFFNQRVAAMRLSLANWNGQALRDDPEVHRALLIAIYALVAFMAFISVTEHHMATIRQFLTVQGDDLQNLARNAFRLHFAGSPNYFYRVILAAVAPMFVIWGLLAGALSRSWSLLLAASLLLVATMIGKLDTLSKAPPMFFLFQLMLAGLLTISNRITWRNALGGACVVSLVLYAVTRLIMTIPEGIEGAEFVYFRVFEVESQALLENFATFPSIHPHMWGANIRPIAMLMGMNYDPSYNVVAKAWHGTNDVTIPALFIADAWADFSYAGVILYSIVAGLVCRSIDAIFLARGKTVVGIAVLGATFVGIFTLSVTALNTALLSGGLLLAPVLAGLLLTANRYIDRRRPAALVEHGAQSN